MSVNNPLEELEQPGSPAAIDLSPFTRSGALELDENTIARSTKRILPPEEDPRTLRYGYNAGVAVMEVHPRDSGRQIALIPSGVLVKFETTPMKRQNFDVDKESKALPEVMDELLALDAVNNVMRNFAGEPDMGFRLLDPLTVLTDDESRRLFGFAHPRFDMIAAHRPAAGRAPASLLEEIAQGYEDCPYELNVCLTCRQDLTKLLDGPTLASLIAGLPSNQRLDHGRLLSTRDIVLDGVSALRRFWSVEFGGWVGEVDDRGKGVGRGIRNLTPGHLYVMQLLHELSPADRANKAAQVYSDSQSETMRGAIDQMGAQIAAAMRQGRDEAAEQARLEMEAVKAQMADMQRAMEEMRAATKTNEAPPETGKKAR